MFVCMYVRRPTKYLMYKGCKDWLMYVCMFVCKKAYKIINV